MDPRYNDKPRDLQICSLLRGFVKSRFFFIYFTVKNRSKFVRFTDDFVISRFHCITYPVFTDSLQTNHKLNQSQSWFPIRIFSRFQRRMQKFTPNHRLECYCFSELALIVRAQFSAVHIRQIRGVIGSVDFPRDL